MTDPRTADLIALRDAASKAYYEGESVMDDAEFDRLTAELAEAGVEETVGHGYFVPEGKVRHARRLLSLEKVQLDAGTEEDAFNALSKWVSETDAHGYLVELKYDGNALALTYESGQLVSAVTRGDGTFGESVDYAVGLMADAGVLPRKIDGVPPVVILKGEVMLTKPAFEKLNAELDGKYSNPRNAAAGIVRRQNGDQAKHLTLIVHDADMIAEDRLSHMGFKVSSNFFQAKVTGTLARSINLVTRDLLAEVAKIDQLRTDLDFETDGVVIKVENRAERRALGETKHAPKWAIAVKHASEIHTVVVTGVEWQLGRTGKLTPVINYTAPNVPGWTNTRATGHNAEMVETLDPRVGDTLKMKRSGEVIPYILGRDDTAPRGTDPVVLPNEFTAPDGITYPVIRDGVNIVVDGYRNPVQSIVYGLGMLGVKGVAESVVTKLVDSGLVTTLSDMLDVTVQDVAQFPGEGTGSGKAVVAAIADAVRGATAVEWFATLGLPRMALTSGGVLVDQFGTLEGIAAATEEELAGLSKFGPIKTAAFLANQHKVAELAAALQARGVTPRVPQQSSTVTEITGKNVVLTGSFPTLSRTAATAAAKQVGANVQSSVSKTTDILIAGDGAGSKMAKAASLGVQVMTAAEFEDMLQAAGA
ncbi:BRCT domain-containing protein [Agromyces humi]|uniref:BRCT domain-containing protein n=1 Tax=Agromyces humi TaxID=1766800 RepID=UPI00135CB518|nr:BRCT domain-containing protein [Agromyces humi]